MATLTEPKYSHNGWSIQRKKGYDLALINELGNEYELSHFHAYKDGGHNISTQPVYATLLSLDLYTFVNCHICGEHCDKTTINKLLFITPNI